MTDEEINAKIPDGYYRVDGVRLREGGLIITNSDEDDIFEPAGAFHAVGDSVDPSLNTIARPMEGYKPKEKKPSTVREWLETLPDGYRELALGQMSRNVADQEECGLAGAVLAFNDWGCTNEGVTFWSAVHEWCEERSELPNLPVQEPWEGASDTPRSLFPTDAAARKEYPVATLIRDYFPHAIAALAHHSYKSQQQHGPASNGAPMEWLKDKSVGDGNQATRHFMEGDTVSAAWRMLELLERELTS